MKEKNPGLREFIERLRGLNHHAQHHEGEWDVEAEWQKLSQRLGWQSDKENGRNQDGHPNLSVSRLGNSPFGLIYRIAAGLTILLLGYYGLEKMTGLSITNLLSPRLVMTEIRTEPGQRVNLVLSDGSRVLLNAASLIRFPQKFASSRREIELEGEAFFEVTKESGSPFCVKARHAIVQVLGTRFDIKAWLDEPGVEVVVERGSVLVQADSSTQQGIVLTAGHMTRVMKGNQPLPPQPASIPASLAWMNGGLLFDHTPFAQVMKELERHYGVHVRLSDTSVALRHLSASFVSAQSLQDVLKAISVALNLTYKQQGNTITFARAGEGS